MSNLVKYESYSAEAAESEAEESEKASAGRFWKPPVGKTVIRVLPPLMGTRWNKAKNIPSPFRVGYQHWIDLPGSKQRVNFICPRLQSQADHSPSQSCPACKQADMLFASGNPADADIAKRLNASRQVFANIILRADPERGPVVWAFGKKVHDQFTAMRSENDVAFCDPINGFDVTVKRTGTGQYDTEYLLIPHRQSSPLEDDADIINAWLENARDLDREARIPTPEEIRKMMAGEPEAGSAPVHGRPRPSGGRQQAQGNQPRRRTAADDADVVEGEVVDE